MKRIELYRCKDEIINDAYDRAVVNIFLQKEKNGNRSFLLCGSDAGVGTTSISVELAISLSVAGWKTILLDGDLRKGSSYKRLNEDARVGLSDYICWDTSMEEIVYETNWDLLHYIPCGVGGEESPVRQLCSAKMDGLMQMLHDEYDFIIIDVPSINSSVDAQLFAVKADATILVTAMEDSKQKSLEEAMKQLKKAGGNVIGVIQNKVAMDEYKKYIRDFDYFKRKRFIKGVQKKEAK